MRKKLPRHLPSLVAAVAVVLAPTTVQSGPPSSPIPVKVLVITSVAAEASPWIAHYMLTTPVAVPGLEASSPDVLCNASDVCLLTTGIGKANAAASVSAVLYSRLFDLSKTYFVIATAAAINPSEGTVGSVAWASYVVDFALSWEIDARSIPSSWTTGYLGFGTTDPTQLPTVQFGTELYTVAAPLVAKAMSLSSAAQLADNAAAQTLRGMYSGSPATGAPAVVSCDATSGDTVWGGALLAARAEAWTTLLTSGDGTYCTAQQTDNATFAALSRGGSSGLLDASRIAVVHAGAMFDRPYQGESALAALTSVDPSIPSLAVANLATAGELLTDDIVTSWSAWQSGVPQ